MSELFTSASIIKNTCNLFVLGEMDAGVLESPLIVPNENVRWTMTYWRDKLNEWRSL